MSLRPKPSTRRSILAYCGSSGAAGAGGKPGVVSSARILGLSVGTRSPPLLIQAQHSPTESNSLFGKPPALHIPLRGGRGGRNRSRRRGYCGGRRTSGGPADAQRTAVDPEIQWFGERGHRVVQRAEQGQQYEGPSQTPPRMQRSTMSCRLVRRDVWTV